ncbi:hypothetical protein DCC79_12450 [bacterium]|nr:PIN domain-containing protein [Chloroflexi bacterium CFX6]RIL08947.1 MAG: hypothetical protein DCC79_12450 [bacterium]
MVIDTSVFVAAFKPGEPGHHASRAFLGRVSATTQLFAPVVIVPEAAAAFSRGTGSADIGRRFAERLCAERVVTLMPITKPLAARAAELAADHGLRGCDALFVAVAEHLGAALVTLDVDQRQRGAGVVATQEP